jgi:hypothetical protein
MSGSSAHLSTISLGSDVDDDFEAEVEVMIAGELYPPYPNRHIHFQKSAKKNTAVLYPTSSTLFIVPNYLPE